MQSQQCKNANKSIFPSILIAQKLFHWIFRFNDTLDFNCNANATERERENAVHLIWLNFKGIFSRIFICFFRLHFLMQFLRLKKCNFVLHILWSLNVYRCECKQRVRAHDLHRQWKWRHFYDLYAVNNYHENDEKINKINAKIANRLRSMTYWKDFAVSSEFCRQQKQRNALSIAHSSDLRCPAFELTYVSWPHVKINRIHSGFCVWKKHKLKIKKLKIEKC